MTTVVVQDGATASLSCEPIVISTDSAPVSITTEDGVTITPASSSVVVQTEAASTSVVADGTEPVSVTVSEFALALATSWLTGPGATLTYDVNDRLERVDYTDGSFKTFTYDTEGLLTLVSGEDATGATRTINLTYSNGLLTTVSRT